MDGRSFKSATACKCACHCWKFLSWCVLAKASLFFLVTSVGSGLAQIGAMSGADGDSTFRVPVTLYGDDDFTFSLPAGVATDTGGTTNTASEISIPYTLDRVTPSITLSTITLNFNLLFPQPLASPLGPTIFNFVIPPLR